MASLKRIPRARVSLAAALAAAALAGAARADEHGPVRVFVLNSYHLGYIWSDEIIDGLNESLAEPNFSTYIEFLDTHRHLDAEHLDRVAVYLRGKLLDTPRFDVVVACDNPALEFILPQREALFGDAPLVFCGVNNFSDAMIAGRPNITGVAEFVDFGATIELAFTLQPQLEHLIAIGSSAGATGQALLNALRAQKSRWGDRLDIQSLVSSDADALASRVGQLGPHDALLLFHNVADRSGRVLPYRKTIELIYDRASVPTYTMWDFGVTLGATAGRVVSGLEQGRAAAAMVKRIAAGERAGDIPIQRDSPNLYMLNERQMRRFGLALDRAPESSRIVAAPASFYQEHWGLIWGLVAASAVQAALITFMVISRIRLRAAQAAHQESERRLQLAMQGANLSAWDHDVPTGRVFRSEHLAEMLGYAPRELEPTLAAVEHLIHPDDLERVRRFRREHELGERPASDVEYRIRTGSGGYRWLHERGQIVERDEFGRPRRIAGVSIDVTERKLAEQALAESDAKYRTVAERASDAILIVQDDRIAYGNPRLAELTGRPLGALVGAPISSLLPDQDFASLVDGRSLELDAGSSPPVADATIRRGDGEHREVEFSVARVSLEGRPALLSVVRDVTERRRAEHARRALDQQIAQTQRMESLGVLAGGVAHDFNNLLVGVMGHAELALDAHVGGRDAAASLHAIVAAAGQAADLTRKLLAYAGRTQPLRQHVDVNTLVRETARLMEVTVSRTAWLELALGAELPCVFADATELRQVVMNLLTNACEAIAAPPGRIRVSTRLVAGPPGDEGEAVHAGDSGAASVEIAVSDNGAGMDEQTRARIFEPFFTTKFAGRGLGLAATFGIVRAHRGVIRVESEPGAGTTIRVLLPVDDHPASTARDGAPPIVLLVDADPGLRALSRELLERGGFSVRDVGEVDAAAAAAVGCDAIVLTIYDWSLDGLDMLSRAVDNTPIIVVMAAADGEAASRLAARGAACVLSRPVRSTQLLDALRHALGAPAPA